MWLITLGHAFTHWCPATFYLLLPFLVRELNLTYSQAGFLITIRSVANFAVNIPSGILVDIIGRRGLLMALALICTGIPYFFVGLSYSYFWVVVFMAFVGVGNYLWHPAAISTLSEKYPDRRGFAIAIHAVGPNVGEMISPVLVGVLLLYLTWRHVLFLNLIPGLVIALVLWKFLFGKPEMPRPMASLAVEPKARGDEGKISTALHKLAMEDPTFVVRREATTHEMILDGLSDLHLQVMLLRLKRRFHVEVNTPPTSAGVMSPPSSDGPWQAPQRW